MFIFLSESEEGLFCKVELIISKRMSYEEFKIFVFTCKYITCISKVHNPIFWLYTITIGIYVLKNQNSFSTPVSGLNDLFFFKRENVVHINIEW